MTKWIRADHAQAEKEAAVAAAREACASRLESLKDTAYQNNLLAEGVTYSCAIDAIRARSDTDALAARDAQVRAEALREAVEIVGGWHDNGNKPSDLVVMKAEADILALIPADQEGDE